MPKWTGFGFIMLDKGFSDILIFSMLRKYILKYIELENNGGKNIKNSSKI